MKNKTTKLPPSKLYKYENVSLQTLENLVNKMIWFSRSEKFNDPYDPAPPYPAELNDDELQIIYDFFSKKIDGKDESDAMFLKDGKINDEFRSLTTKILRETVTKELNVSDIGIACFSAIHDDFLMWSHYADGHRGFCLEFDSTFEPFNRAREVVYSETYPLINLAAMITKKAAKADPYGLQKLLLTKSFQWGYEKEWRVFSDGDTGFVYDKSALTAVHFGSAMPSKHRELITQLLMGTSTQLYEMRKAISAYKIESHFLGS